MNTYSVYCHTNLKNGKKYFGITSREPEKRWLNGKGYKNNEHFSRAIAKYGWDGFSHEVLYIGLSKSEAEQIEVELIQEHCTTKSHYGYNIEAGGNSTEKFTPEIKQKISQALKGHECSEKTRAKISAANRGKPSPNKGKKMTSNQIEKNRKAHMGAKPWNKGRPWSPEERSKCNGKPVKCVETGLIYRTAHEAYEATGIDFSSICKCRKGKVKTAGGYHWEEVT